MSNQATETRVVLVKPGDVLVFGNIGRHRNPSAMLAVIGALRDATGLSDIMLFEGDIDMALVNCDG